MSNWYVLTGGPSSGKTTMVNLLHEMGYTTTIEHARHYLDLKRIEGKSVDEVRSRQIEFQHAVLEMQVAQEAELNALETVFLDRAIPDSLAYYRFLGIEPDAEIKDAMKHVSYRKIFILDLLPLAPDYARTEDASAQRQIHELLIEVYEELDSPVIKVPALLPDARAQFILENL